MSIANLELTIARSPDGATTVSMRVELPHHRVDPVGAVPVAITDAALLALSNDADDYGAMLTAMVFPAPLAAGHPGILSGRRRQLADACCGRPTARPRRRWGRDRDAGQRAGGSRCRPDAAPLHRAAPRRAPSFSGNPAQAQAQAYGVAAALKHNDLMTALVIADGPEGAGAGWDFTREELASRTNT